MHLLAESNNFIAWVGVIVSILAGVFGTINTYLVMTLQRSFDKRCREEQASVQEIHSLKTSVHESTVRLIDERFRGISHEVRNHANGVMLAMDELKSRVKEGDLEGDTLAAAVHAIELKMRGWLDEMKDYIRINTASKEDAKDLEKRVSILSEKVAVLTEKVTCA
jgi:hypothetical protein